MTHFASYFRTSSSPLAEGTQEDSDTGSLQHPQPSRPSGRVDLLQPGPPPRPRREMQDDEGGGLSSSLYSDGNAGSSSNGDIGIPDFNEDDYLDLSILNDDVGGMGEDIQVQDRNGDTELRQSQQQQQQQQPGKTSSQDIQSSTSYAQAESASSDSSASKSQQSNDGRHSQQQEHQHQQQRRQQDGQEDETNSNDSDRQSHSSGGSEQNESTTSTAQSQSEPPKPLTDSPSTYAPSMKLPNGDGNSQTTAFPPPASESSIVDDNKTENITNGQKSSPSPSGAFPTEPALHLRPYLT